MPEIKVLSLGIDPWIIDFSGEAYSGLHGITAEKVHAGVEWAKSLLGERCCQYDVCMVDFGETAELVLRLRLEREFYDCVMIGAGIRLIPANTPLFEKLINVVHELAPRAKICFNTSPTDSVEAIGRWFPEARS